MKLIKFLAAAAIVVLAACGSPYRATNTTVYVAPERTRTAFINQYPNASNVVWSHYDPATVTIVDWELNDWTVLDHNDYQVRFNMDNEDYYAWYNDDGDWIGTAYVVRDYHRMPDIVNNMIRNQYPGYTITSVKKEFQKDRMTYEIELKNGDSKAKMLVDSNGNILKEKNKDGYGNKEKSKYPNKATNTNNPTEVMRTAFVRQYPTATNVVWSHYDPSVVTVVDWDLNNWTTLNESDYVVRFNLDNDDYYAWYDDNGEWVGTAYVVRNYQTMPALINTMLIDQYPDYSVKSVKKQFQKDRIAYEIEMKNKNDDTKIKMLVDGNGNIIKKKTKY